MTVSDAEITQDSINTDQMPLSTFSRAGSEE